MKFLLAGRASVLAAGSQGLGLIQITLLLWGVGANEASDAYFYIASWNQLPAQILLLGVMYPVWLRGSGIGHRMSRFWILATPAITSLTTVLAGIIFSCLSDPYPELWIQVVLFCGLGISSSVCWAGVLWLSSHGRPSWFAAITLCSNLLSCLGLLVAVLFGFEDRVTLMVALQFTGMTIYAIIITIKNRGIWGELLSFGPKQEPVAIHGTSAAHWYLSQSVAGYGAGLALQTQAALLLPGSLSILGIIGRVLAGMNSLVTNANLPRLFHSKSESAELVYRYLYLVLISSSAISIPIIALEIWFENRWIAMALVILSWFCAAALNASVKRIMIRYLSPRLSLISIAVSVSVPLVLFGAHFLVGIDLATVLVAYVLLDLLSGIAFGLILGRWRLCLGFAVFVTVALCFSLPWLGL